MRLFFSVRLSAELQQRIFDELVKPIPQNGFSRTKKENLHVTLLFLGEVSKQKIAELKEKAGWSHDFEPFEIELNSIGHFNQRVIWLEVTTGETELKKLNSKLCKALGLAGSGFHAHVTLCRVKPFAQKLVQQLVEKLNQKNFAARFEVKGFELLESKPSPAGSVYRPIFGVLFEPLKKP